MYLSNNFIKKIIISILLWHIIIFYFKNYIFHYEFIKMNYCICGSNPFINTYYICSNNIIQSYISNKLLNWGVIKSSTIYNLLNPYEIIFPMKFIYSNNICF